MSDSISHRVSIEPLRGPENFPVWKIKMTDVLTDLSLEDYIEAGATAPNDATLQPAWKKADRKTLATIRLRVADSVLVYISGSKTALAAWETLSNMFEAKGPIGIVIARRNSFAHNVPTTGTLRSTSG